MMLNQQYPGSMYLKIEENIKAEHQILHKPQSKKSRLAQKDGNDQRQPSYLSSTVH